MIKPFLANTLRDAPWDDWVRRVILHVPHYLSPNGDPTSGGRQRKVRDIARIVKELWGRDCIVAQKASRNFEVEDSLGTPVVGIKSRLSVYGDPAFGRATSRLLRNNDAIIYLGGEDAWPYFVRNAKGFHVGVWWDGPHSKYKKAITALRTEAFFDACRSILCCDANVINWLRTRDAKFQAAANRAVYIPNSVDLNMLPSPEVRSHPHEPLRLLFARRFEKKRGPQLALEAAGLLKRRGIPFHLTMSTAIGQTGSEDILRAARSHGIEEDVRVVENDLDSVFQLYAQADVAIVPTVWSEGTSYSCVEALAAGLPVVTTNVGGLPNLVVPGFNGYAEPPNAERIATAIASLTDPATWTAQHKNALSMRAALSKELWDQRVLEWLKQ